MEVQSLFTSPQLDSAELAALMRNKCLHGVFISLAQHGRACAFELTGDDRRGAVINWMQSSAAYGSAACVCYELYVPTSIALCRVCVRWFQALMGSVLHPVAR